MEHREVLASLGLSDMESAIYLAALELGESLPKHLAEKAGIKRPMLYKLLPDLLDKGLLTQSMQGKRRTLVAEDPEVLVEKKRAELATLEETIPVLRLLLRTATVKPHIAFYEGLEGLKRIYMDNLREQKTILNFVGLENIHPEVDLYARNYYIPQRINRRIPIKIIVSGDPTSKRLRLKTDPDDYREIKMVSREQFPIPLDGYIYGDNVSFLLFRSDSEPMGVIIRSREIATTLRSLFELIWQAY